MIYRTLIWPSRAEPSRVESSRAETRRAESSRVEPESFSYGLSNLLGLLYKINIVFKPEHGKRKLPYSQSMDIRAVSVQVLF